VTGFVHATALLDADVEIGIGTQIWDNVHARSGARIGADCIIGEKTYIGPRVRIGDRCKVNALAYLCEGVTLETGVMVAAGVVFTNDLLPRATTPDLRQLRASIFGEDHVETLVREGASIGGGVTILGGVTIGRFAMVGMGAVVTRSVADFHLVRGNPATAAAAVCRCGQVVRRFAEETRQKSEVACVCGLRYAIERERVTELDPP